MSWIMVVCYTILPTTSSPIANDCSRTFLVDGELVGTGSSHVSQISTLLVYLPRSIFLGVWAEVVAETAYEQQGKTSSARLSKVRSLISPMCSTLMC